MYRPKKCEYCGKDYTAKNIRSKYCSDSCRSGSYKKRKKAKGNAFLENVRKPPEQKTVPSEKKIEYKPGFFTLYGDQIFWVIFIGGAAAILYMLWMMVSGDRF